MKLIFTLFAAFLFSGLSSQILFEEYFDNGMPESVVLENLDELTPDDPDLATMADSAWTVRNIAAQGFCGGSGSNAAFSVSWYVGDDGPSDDWMILPGVDVGNDPYLSWTGMAITSSGNFRDQYQVFVVSEGQDIANLFLAAPIFDTGQTGEEIEETFHQISLADFANETVYVAFRNFTQPYNPDLPTGPGNGGNELAIDNIVISDGPVNVLEASAIEVNVWPVPAQDVVNVALETEVTSAQWTLIDNTGKLVAQNNSNLMLGQLQIDISAFASGVYTLQLQTDKGQAATRLMID